MAEEPRLALDRVTFLLAFVPYLDQHPGGVPVAEAARHFGYSADFIRRSAQQLTVTGYGDYYPDQLFDIDWDALEEQDLLVLTNRVVIDDAPRLSSREAAALIAGLEIVRQHPAAAALPQVQSLAEKLRLAGDRPTAPAIAPGSVPHLGELLGAIRDGRQVAFDYQGAGEAVAQHRVVDPIRVDSTDAEYRLKAWCHLRGAVRTFRLDRIVGLHVLDAASEHGIADLEGEAGDFGGDLSVQVAFDAGAVPLAADYRPSELSVDRAAGSATMTVRLAAAEVLHRLLAELPGAEVVGPPQVRDSVRRWAEESLSRYHDAAE